MSDTVSDAQRSRAAAQELPTRPARTRLQRRIRQMLVGIFLLYAGVLFAVLLVVMALAFFLLFFTLHLAAMRTEIMRRRVRTLMLMQADAAAGR